MQSKKPLLFRKAAFLNKIPHKSFLGTIILFSAVFYLAAFAPGLTLLWRNGVWRLTLMLGLILYIPALLAFLYLLIWCLQYFYAAVVNRPGLLQKGDSFPRSKHGIALLIGSMFLLTVLPLFIMFLIWSTQFVPHTIQDISQGPLYYHGSCSVDVEGSGKFKTVEMTLNDDTHLYALGWRDYRKLVTPTSDTFLGKHEFDPTCRVDVSVWYLRSGYIAKLEYSN